LLGSKLELPISGDTERFILDAAHTRWQKEGQFLWLPAAKGDEDDADPNPADQALASDEEVGFDLETLAAYFPEFMNTDDNFTYEQRGPHPEGPHPHTPEPEPIATDPFVQSVEFVTERIVSSLLDPAQNFYTPMTGLLFGPRSFSEALGFTPASPLPEPPSISLHSCGVYSDSSSYHNYYALRLLEMLQLV